MGKVLMNASQTYRLIVRIDRCSEIQKGNQWARYQTETSISSERRLYFFQNRSVAASFGINS